MSGRAHLAVVGLAVSTGGLGCTGSPPPRSQFPSGADALSRMKATYACSNGIQGAGKLDVLSDQGRVRGNAAVFAVNPARVRIDIESSFNSLVYALASDGEVFRMADNPQKLFLTGPAKACNLARLTRVPVPGHALVSLMRGEAPLLVHEPGAATIRWEDGHYVVEVPSTRSAKLELWLEVYDDDRDKDWREQRVRVRRVEVLQSQVPLYSVDLDDYASTKTAPARVDPDGIEPDLPPSGGACEAETPREIHFVVPTTGDDVVFKYDQVSFNPPLPQGAFSLNQPAGARVQVVDCVDAPTRPASP
ncbi:MAG: hypothetical protein AAGA56_06210 [Myxococcota bacterium]